MANILVIGAGVVGSATGRGFNWYDHKVTFVDISEEARRRVRELGFVALEPEQLNLTDTDAVFVSVTALTTEQGIDLGHLTEASRTLGAALRRIVSDSYPVIVYRCTMPPGTTRRLTRILEAESGRRAGADFGVAYNPEYLRAKSAYEDFVNPRLVTVGALGDDERAVQIVRDVYRPFKVPVMRTDVEDAEFQKYVHNLFNATKISFFNEMRRAARRLGIADAETAFEITARSAEGMWNPSYGIGDHGPYGGACLPKDTAAWLIEMDRRGVESPVIAATRAVNVQIGGR